jgi:UDP-N-acetylglucosamine:LPS N-acetylglucosamine transferase
MMYFNPGQHILIVGGSFGVRLFLQYFVSQNYRDLVTSIPEQCVLDKYVSIV